MLTISFDKQPRYKYVFNKGGAISGVFDLKIAPKTNLVGDSFQGETTDRVIQWTYWNSRYLGKPHKLGDGDRRANVLMEGCFRQAFTCDVLKTPASGDRKLVFQSRITHWFYAVQDRHGRPEFQTTSEYEVLKDGSLKLIRSVLRKPWRLKAVEVKTRQDGQWTKSPPIDVKLKAKNLGRGTLTSYFEAWTPLRRTVLPDQRHANGVFKKDGYRSWKPADLGGWSMAYGQKQALAIVFGVGRIGPAQKQFNTQPVYNKRDFANHKLNCLLPGVETDWPDDATLTQTLIFVVGEPTDVMRRARALVKQVPAPQVSQP